MEVRQSTHEKMWFKVCGKRIKFSIEEFALVSRLKCDEDGDMRTYEVGVCRSKDTYFTHKRKFFRKDIELSYRNLPLSTLDKDGVKLRILYLITSFVFTSPNPNLVSKAAMRLVESLQMNGSMEEGTISEYAYVPETCAC